MIDPHTREILLDLAAVINRRAYDPAADTETLVEQCEQTLKLAKAEEGNTVEAQPR